METGAGVKTSEETSDQACLTGRRYHGGHALITRGELEAYAAATSDESIVYFGPDAIAPPMFHVALMRDLMFQVLEDPALQVDMLRLLHGEHDARFLRPLVPGEVLTMRGELLRVQDKPRGRLISFRMAGHVRGTLVVDARTTFIVRSPTAAPAVRTPAPPLDPADPAPQARSSWSVAADQSQRYAAASGDRNPLHLDTEVARRAGQPEVILHGLCTLAMAGASVLRRLAFDDPRKLRRLQARFAAPVFNSSNLETRMWTEQGGARFDVIDEAGVQVIRSGRVVLSD